MSGLNDQDWEQLNAYHDGELNAAERARIDRRLAGDPDFAAALADIGALSRALRGMRPAPAQIPEPAPRKRNFIWPPLAIAASVAAALLIAGSVFLMRPGQPDTSAGWHSEFLSREYSVPLPADLQPAGVFGTRGAPDLSAANLLLVDRRQNRDGAMALHYAGKNGCRLTLTVGFGAGVPDEPPNGAGSEVLSRHWTTRAVSYMVLSTGMDPARFDAISIYIRQLSERWAQPATVLAMQQSTDRAVPCSDERVRPL